MSNDVQYFAKVKGIPSPVKPIGGWTAVKTLTPAKGLLQYKPSHFEVSFEFQSPKKYKDLRAILLGYARPSGIKRTRKRQIERAKFMSLPPYQRKRYKALNLIAKAICSCGITINELSKPKKRSSVTNQKRWK